VAGRITGTGDAILAQAHGVTNLVMETFKGTAAHPERNAAIALS
jgi:hypothetical protein